MNLTESLDFQNGQRDAVTKIGAFIHILQASIAELDVLAENASEMEIVRRLQPVVGEFISKNIELYTFYNKYHYDPYFQVIAQGANQISHLLARQTMPSSKTILRQFGHDINIQVNVMSEAMIDTAQIVTPNVDANIKANNPFSAFIFLTNII